MGFVDAHDTFLQAAARVRTVSEQVQVGWASDARRAAATVRLRLQRPSEHYEIYIFLHVRHYAVCWKCGVKQLVGLGGRGG